MDIVVNDLLWCWLRYLQYNFIDSVLFFIDDKKFYFKLGITTIGGNFNPYIMYFVSCIAELIGYSICFLNDKFSRKKVMIAFLMMAALVCLIVTAVPNELEHQITWRSILIISFASIGKAMASAAFNSGYVYTFKMFPTGVRSTLFTLCSSIGKLGSIISPQINLLRNLVWEPMPYLIFSASAFIGSIFLCVLPDPSKLNY